MDHVLRTRDVERGRSLAASVLYHCLGLPLGAIERMLLLVGASVSAAGLTPPVRRLREIVWVARAEDP